MSNTIAPQDFFTFVQNIAPSGGHAMLELEYTGQGSQTADGFILSSLEASLQYNEAGMPNYQLETFFSDQDINLLDNLKASLITQDMNYLQAVLLYPDSDITFRIEKTFYYTKESEEALVTIHGQLLQSLGTTDLYAFTVFDNTHYQNLSAGYWLCGAKGEELPAHLMSDWIDL